tara:strand:+ start:11592 stop:12305 length:714 start_codon:yes stop_codon:yes gene_type:complete
MTLKFLNHFFNSLNESNLSYCVLRGYESLPEKINNDIDFGVSNSFKFQFFDILKETTKNHGYIVQVELIRHSVIKMKLTNRYGNIIKIDVWWQFNYLGLEYLSINKMLNSRKLYKNIFYVPSIEYEFALSYLKELLHNSWIRTDKVEVLTLKMKEKSHVPFNKYFNKNIIDDFFISVETKKFKLKLLSLRAKFSILLKNTSFHGLFYVLINIYRYLKIRFLYRNEYYNLMNKLVDKK